MPYWLIVVGGLIVGVLVVGLLQTVWRGKTNAARTRRFLENDPSTEAIVRWYDELGVSITASGAKRLIRDSTRANAIAAITAINEREAEKWRRQREYHSQWTSICLWTGRFMGEVESKIPTDMCASCGNKSAKHTRSIYLGPDLAVSRTVSLPVCVECIKPKPNLDGFLPLQITSGRSIYEHTPTGNYFYEIQGIHPDFAREFIRLNTARYPISVPAKPYRMYRNIEESARRIEDYINGKMTDRASHIFTYLDIELATNIDRDVVRHLLFALDGGCYNWITVINPSIPNNQ